MRNAVGEFRLRGPVVRALCALVPIALSAGCAGERPVGATADSTVAPTQPGGPPVTITSPSPTSTQPTSPAADLEHSQVPIVTVNSPPNQLAIPESELLEPLIRAHGLSMLFSIVQRDLARQGALFSKPPIVLTEADFKAERQQTLDHLFQEADARIDEAVEKAQKEKNADQVRKLRDEQELEHQQLLRQFYAQEHITATDFDILMQTNAYLRKTAEPQIAGQITDDLLRKTFAANYGEKVYVSHIQLDRPQDYAEVLRELAAGASFEDLARKYSRDPNTAPLGGRLLPFTRAAPQYTQVFKDVAFSLKVGQVSDLIEVNNTFQLIKLERREMPRGVTFEQERDIVYRNVHEQLVQVAMNAEREAIAAVALKTLKINNPVLAEQFEERVHEHEETNKGRKAAEDEMAKETMRSKMLMEDYLKHRASTQATTRPAPVGPRTAPTSAPARPAAPEPLATLPPASTAPASPPAQATPAPTTRPAPR